MHCWVGGSRGAGGCAARRGTLLAVWLGNFAAVWGAILLIKLMAAADSMVKRSQACCLLKMLCCAGSLATQPSSIRPTSDSMLGPLL